LAQLLLQPIGLGVLAKLTKRRNRLRRGLPGHPRTSSADEGNEA
jgi:hypothetical protein